MKTLNHKFVDKIPEEIEEGILYVSIPYETAIHKCCCGCGSEVVTPISPTLVFSLVNSVVFVISHTSVHVNLRLILLPPVEL